MEASSGVATDFEAELGRLAIVTYQSSRQPWAETPLCDGCPRDAGNFLRTSFWEGTLCSTLAIVLGIIAGI